MDFFKGFIHFFFKDLYHIHKSVLISVSGTSYMLHYSRPVVVGLLGYSGDVLSLQLLVTF